MSPATTEQLHPSARRLIETARPLAAENDQMLVTRRLEACLSALGVTAAMLPGWSLAPRDHDYARHRLHLCEHTGQALYVMVWQPGQGSPIHDHGGAWGVVAGVRGQLDIIEYGLTPSQEQGNRQVDADSLETMTRPATIDELRRLVLGPGATGSTWAPGNEIHQIRNGSDQLAISLHLYSNEIRQYQVYDQAEGTARSVTAESDLR